MGRFSISRHIPFMAKSDPGCQAIWQALPIGTWVRRGEAWLISALLIWGAILLFLPGTGQGAMSNVWVKYRNGKLSMAFDQTPIEVALEAVRAKTGIRVNLPEDTRGKLLSVRVHPLPLEEAMCRLLWALGLDSFALLYDKNGQAQYLIVLKPGSATSEPTVLHPGSKPDIPSVPSQLAAPERRLLTGQEDPPITREQRQRLRELFPPR